MPKSLILALPIALLAFSPLPAAGLAHPHATISSGRSVSRDMREQWFRKSVGDILEGRVAPAKRERRY